MYTPVCVYMYITMSYLMSYLQQALHYLAEVPSNRGLMKNEVGLVISLRNVMRRTDYNRRIIQLAHGVHDLLIPPSGAHARYKH